MIVQKFGGTSIGTANRIKEAADIVNNKKRTLVVLSAMSGTTNSLVETVELCKHGEIRETFNLLDDLERKYYEVVNELFESIEVVKKAVHFIKNGFEKLRSDILNNDFKENEILSLGEFLSTELFYRLLIEKRRNAVFLSAPDFIKLTNDREPDKAYLKIKLNEVINKHPEAGIFITQGFICKNAKGEMDNLGRGGSDYSATLMGEAIGVDEVQIWTDVDGLQNNDPRFVENTRPIRQISFDEAAELAYFGAKILHPQSILPAKNAGINVWLKNTLKPQDKGTLISNASNGKGFKAVAAKDNITAIKIKSGRMFMAYGFIRKVFEVFEKYKTPVDMITTSEVAVSITIDCDDRLQEIIADLSQYGSVEVDKDQTIVAVVGEVIASENGYAHQLFSALKHIPVRMISYGASRHNISILISGSDKVRTLRAIHHGVFNQKFLSYAE